MGQCDIVETIEIGGDRVTVFRQDKEATRTATVVVRGATTNQMDDVERAIDDGVNVVKGIIKDPRLVAGAGATELELAKRIAEYGEKTPGLAQHAIKRFADALEVVPRTLAENAGLDATDVLSRLYAAHHSNDAGVVGVDIDVSWVWGINLGFRDLLLTHTFVCAGRERRDFGRGEGTDFRSPCFDEVGNSVRY